MVRSLCDWSGTKTATSNFALYVSMSNVHCLNDLRSRPDVEAGSGFWSTRRVPGNGDSARRSGEFLLMSEGRDPASLRCVDLFFPDFTWMSSILWFSFAQITVYIITVCMGSHQLQPKSYVSVGSVLLTARPCCFVYAKGRSFAFRSFIRASDSKGGSLEVCYPNVFARHALAHFGNLLLSCSLCVALHQ